MRMKHGAGDTIFAVANTTLMLLLVTVTLYPLLYVAFASFSNPTLLMQHRGILWRPLEFTIRAYEIVLANPMIAIGYRNTLAYVVFGTALNLLMTCLGAYGLSRRGLMLKRPLMLLITFTMFFGGGLIPTYLLVAKTLNMHNSPWALIIPGAINTWNLIIMRTAFESVPVALEEAARIDGANDLVILVKVVLPLSLPVIAVMILFYAVAHWNSWFPAAIYLRTRTLYPLQIILREILIANSIDDMMLSISRTEHERMSEAVKYATTMVATVPILCVYPFLQRYFVKGVMIGAIKE